MSIFRRRSAPSPEPVRYQGREIPEEAVTRTTITPGAVTAAKLGPDAVESAKVDPNDPLYVHTLVVWALKKVGMGQEEADRYAAAHQQHAVDADRATEK